MPSQNENNNTPQSIFSSSDIPAPDSSAPKKSKTNLTLILTFAILAVIGTGFGIYGLTQNSNSNNTTNSELETPNHQTSEDLSQNDVPAAEQNDVPAAEQNDNAIYQESARETLLINTNINWLDSDEADRVIKEKTEENNRKYGDLATLLGNYVGFANFTNAAEHISASFGYITDVKNKDDFEVYKYTKTLRVIASHDENKRDGVLGGRIIGICTDATCSKIISEEEAGDGWWNNDSYRYVYQLSYDELNSEYHKLFSGDVKNLTEKLATPECIPIYSTAANRYLGDMCGGYGFASGFTSAAYFILNSTETTNQLVIQIAYEQYAYPYTADDDDIHIEGVGDFDISNENFHNKYFDQLPRYQFTFVKENGNYVLADFTKM